MVSASALRLAALMSAISSATLAAVKLAGTARSSSGSTISRARRRGANRELVEDRCIQRCHSRWKNMVISLHEAVCETTRHLHGAQTERRGDAGLVRGLLGRKDLTSRFVERHARRVSLLPIRLTVAGPVPGLAWREARFGHELVGNGAVEDN